MPAEKHKPSAERCPFDPDVIKAEDCPYEDNCPWHVREDEDNCFCAVGETPDLQMRKMIASNLPREEEED
jgi:hypothetical protein